MKKPISFLVAVSNNALRTNYIKAKIDNTLQNCKCRLSGGENEIVNHKISKIRKLTQNK